MIRFESPEILYLLLLVPILVGLFWIYRRRQTKLIERFGDEGLLRPLMKGFSRGRVLLKFVLLTVAVGVLVVAIARPQIGSRLAEKSTSGAQIVMAVDVSRSMLAEDFTPNRLERTKYATGQLIEKLRDQQIALVVFAGDAYIQLPITGDFKTAASFVRSISTDMVSNHSTSLQNAIEKSIAAMPLQEGQTNDQNRAIIIITDGESHSDDPIAAAKTAAEQGITIHTIGIGTPEGAPITINGDMIKDQNGEVVISALDETTLGQIAATTGGMYIRSTQQEIGLQQILRQIDRMTKGEFKTVEFEAYAEQFFYFLYIVLALIIIEFFIPNHKATKDKSNEK